MNSFFHHELENNSRWIKLKALTPVHVGTDQSRSWIRDIDFDYERGKIYSIDKDRFLHALSKDEIQELCLDSRSRKLAGKRKNFRLEPGFDFPSNCVSHSFTSINPQIRDGLGRPYLPGSSIKGAMRAILHAAKKPRIGYDRKFEKDYLGKISNSPLRFMRVSDGYLSKTEVFPAKILSLSKNKNVWEAGWKHQRHGSERNLQPAAFMTAYEAFPAGAEGVFRLCLLPELMNWVRTNQMSDKDKPVHLKEIDSLATLFQCINANIRRRIEAEYQYIEQVAQNLNESAALCEAWQELRDRLPNEQESGSRCILRLGRNVGAHSTTGDWEFAGDYLKPTLRQLSSDPSSRKTRKTRKFALRFRDEDWQFQPFGFVELSLIEDQKTAHQLHAQRLIVPDQPKPAQASTLQTEAPEPVAEPPKALAAEAFTGKLKEGAVVEAVALRSEGNNVVFEIYLASGNQNVAVRYPAGCEAGSVHRLTISKVKDGKIQQAQYKSAKK